MYGSRLASGLVAVLAGIALLFGLFGVVYNLVFLPVAAIFGAAAALIWYHGSGRFAARLYRGVERQARVEDERRRRGDRGRRRGNDAERGGFGAGPREEWVPPRDERRQRARATTGRDGRGRTRGRRGGRRVGPAASDGPSAAEAYRVLGLDRGADQDAVRRAYREKVKDVHPDSPSGDEERFKEVKAAYERLADD